MSKDLEPYEGDRSWGRGASQVSEETQGDVQARNEEVKAVLQRGQTSELDQQRPTRAGVEAEAAEVFCIK